MRSDYPLTDEYYDELVVWTKLQSALSYTPPEKYRPGSLCEEEGLEYFGLTGRIIRGRLRLAGLGSDEE